MRRIIMFALLAAAGAAHADQPPAVVAAPPPVNVQARPVDPKASPAPLADARALEPAKGKHAGHKTAAKRTKRRRKAARASKPAFVAEPWRDAPPLEPRRLERPEDTAAIIIGTALIATAFEPVYLVPPPPPPPPLYCAPPPVFAPIYPRPFRGGRLYRRGFWY